MPRVSKPMKGDDQERIKRNFTFLKEELHQDEIRDAFMDNGLFDVPDFEEIDAVQPRQKQNEVFLKLIMRSGPDAYEVFLKALEEKGSDHIIEKLNSTEIAQKAESITEPQCQQVDHLSELSEAEKSIVLTEMMLVRFTKVIGADLEIIGKFLNLTQPEIDVVKMDNVHSGVTQIHKLFMRWKSKNGRQATLKKFAQALIDAENFGNARVYWDQFYTAVKAVSDL